MAEQATPERPYFLQGAAATEDVPGGLPADGLATTSHDANQNVILNRIASDMDEQSEALVTAIDAITAAIAAKPSA